MTRDCEKKLAFVNEIFATAHSASDITSASRYTPSLLNISEQDTCTCKAF